MQYQKYDTLVISSGSIGGITILGSLHFLHERKELRFNKYIGTSVGSILCLLSLVGYSPLEIISHLCCSNLLTSFVANNINIFTGEGVFPFKRILVDIEKLLKDKGLSLNYSFSKLYEIYPKIITMVTYNLSEDKTEYLNKDTSPNMSLEQGIRLSCAVPFIFERVYHNSCEYVDGAFGSSFPVEYYTSKKILGINLEWRTTTHIKDHQHDILKFISKLLILPVKSSSRAKVEEYSRLVKHKIINLTLDSDEYSSLSISIPKIMDMFALGYKQTLRIEVKPKME